jgi:hypothetical protein
MSAIINFFFGPTAISVYKGLYYTSPIWVTFLLAVLLWEMWLTYIRARFIAEQEYVLLEIKLPKEIFKSPLSMELLYNTLYQNFGEDTFKIKFDRWPWKISNDFHWKGSVRPWFSLELCSINGKLRFFIWSRVGSRATIEAQLYSQFQGIEIFEVPDYTLPVSYDPEIISLWGTELELTKADPFPIKTYVDYGMDKDPKEEYKIDPMTPLVEFLSSLPSAHQVWIQIVITAHKATDKDPVTGKMIDKKWEKGAEEEIKKILEKAKPPKGPDDKPSSTPPRALTEGEKDTIGALERSVSKRGFDTGIRAIYFAPKDVFNLANTGGIMGGLSHFNSGMNGFKGGPLNDLDHKKRRILNAYKHRGYFWNEFKRKTFVLNTEELATIYHFPSSVGISATPGFERITSKKSEAPANLPL